MRDEYQEYKLTELCYNVFPRRYNLHPEEMPVKVTFNEEETDRIHDILSSVQTYVDESITRFALGDLDVETGWGGISCRTGYHGPCRGTWKPPRRRMTGPWDKRARRNVPEGYSEWVRRRLPRLMYGGGFPRRSGLSQSGRV